jgi:hypothetical protein
MRTGGRDSRALFVPMQTVDSTADRDAAVHADRQRKFVAHLGGKSATDDAKWTPDIGAVRATIRYAIATERLDAN